jgi:YggT family protein
MVLFRNLFIALTDVLHLIISIYIYIVIARAILSWFNPDPRNQLVQFIRRITEPPLAWLRKYIPSFGGLDLTPFVLIILLMFLDRFLMLTFKSFG